MVREYQMGCKAMKAKCLPSRQRIRLDKVKEASYKIVLNYNKLVFKNYVANTLFKQI
jgi:hypothetical protein